MAASDITLAQGRSNPADIQLGIADPVGGWLNDGSTPWRKMGLKAIAVAAILATDPVPPAPAAGIASTVAHASSGAIAVNTWSVYDPTTGPVLPLAVSSAKVLPDDTVFRPLRRKRDLPDTVNAVGVAAGQFLPNFVAQWSEQFQLARRLPKPSMWAAAASTADPVGVAAGQFLPNFVAQWSEQFQLSRRVPKPSMWAAAASTADPVGVAAGQFLPNFVAQWSEQFQLARRVSKPGMWAAAASTADAIFTPAAPTANFVAQWSEQFQLARRLPKPGMSAAAASTADAIPVAVAQVTIVGSSSSAVVVNTWSVYDPTTGPVFPPTAGVAPPAVGANWLEDSIRLRSTRKVLPEGTAAPVGVAAGQFLANFLPQWGEQFALAKRKWRLGALDETAWPRFPQVVVVTQTLVDAQFDLAALRRRKIRPLDETSAPVTIAAGQFLANFLPQWGEQFRLSQRKYRKGIFDPTSAPVFPPVVVAPPTFGANWLEQSLKVSVRCKLRWEDAPFPFRAAIDFSSLIQPCGREAAVVVESRSVAVSAENRSATTAAESPRASAVTAESRTSATTAENRAVVTPVECP